MVSLGDSLRKARKQAGFTQEELAEHVGVSRAAIARYEAGEIEPSLKTMILLCDALHVSADALLGREQAPVRAFEELPPQAVKALEEFIRSLRADVRAEEREAKNEKNIEE